MYFKEISPLSFSRFKMFNFFGKLVLVVGLSLLGFTLLNDQALQAQFTDNFTSLAGRVKNIVPQLEQVFASKVHATYAIQGISYVLLGSVVLIFRRLKFLAIFQLVALLSFIGVLVCQTKTNDQTETAIMYITKTVGVVGGLLYYLGC